MEKTTKKSKKKSRRLKKRIGIIAVGGLSFVLTICLSVGATLAWFAGSSWASNDLYMGGPVYVEMAGKGTAPGDGTDTASWVGGSGNLDIKAAASRSTGTVGMDTDASGNYTKGDGAGDTIPDNILLPGQKVQIFSQARVFSTAVTDTRSDNDQADYSSGSNNANTTNKKEVEGVAKYVDGKGRVTTTTTSVLRARFSISIEFDPSVGFNNFTDKDYMEGYPAQTEADWAAAASASLVWNTTLGQDNTGKRRDAVDPTGKWETKTDGTEDINAIRGGTKKSIYKWRYVSATEYSTAGTAAGEGVKLVKFKANSALGGGTGADAGGYETAAYACYICENGALVESDAFYKARTNAYLQSYVEYYENEYGNVVTRTIAGSIATLDNALNESFVQLVNDSSDDIQTGNVHGYTVNEQSVMTPAGTATPTKASWLYIDPAIGNDTNTNEISTSTGGWWYLVSSEGKFDDEGGNKVDIVTDSVTDPTDTNNEDVKAGKNEEVEGTAVARTNNDGDFGPADDARLDAKLFEIKPEFTPSSDDAYVGLNGTTKVKKISSVSFPFVNGTFALPGDALTNIFANAKISFQISFQAIQAFFPYTQSIDGIGYENALLGTAKVLSIRNAIPIYNEAFDYQETYNNGGVDSTL